MPCPHNEITIVQRSQRQSAVAAAAYQSGEKLFCEYDQQVKHYPEKRGIVHNEILLPANAPQEYADRNTLWNAAEAVEKQWNSQLARRWVLTIPREIPPDQYAVLVREFCEQQFVSKGMIADFAIHDPHPPGHNPHAHVLLTMRAMDEHGKWLTQQMLAVRGIVSAEIEVVRGADTLKTEKWQINVEECANPENQIESTDEYKTIQQLLAETEAAKTAAAASASNAAKSAQEAKDAAAQAAADAKKVIDEGVNDKLQQMQKIQTDVTAKADKVSTDAAKVEGYAKAAQYLIGYNEKNILTVFLYEE